MTVTTTADHTNDHHSDHDSYHHMWRWLTITVNTTTDHHSNYGSDHLQLTTSRTISVHYDQPTEDTITMTTTMTTIIYQWTLQLTTKVPMTITIMADKYSGHNWLAQWPLSNS